MSFQTVTMTLLDGFLLNIELFAVTLGIRYRFNATNSKYKGTGAGQSQKRRM